MLVFKLKMEKKERLGKYKRKIMIKSIKKISFLFVLLQFLISCGNDTPKEITEIKTVEVQKPAVPVLEYSIVATFLFINNRFKLTKNDDRN